MVFDKYQDNYIKNSERSVQGGETGHQLQSITGAQIVRQWRTFLLRIANRTSVITLTVSEWRKAQYREKLHGKVLYATVDDKVTALQCHQEEADRRLLFHATHAARVGYQAVVICSEDTCHSW